MRLEVRGINTMTHKFVRVWGMYVDGFDPNTHCQDCLKGKPEKALYKKLAILQNSKLPQPAEAVAEPITIELSDSWPYFYLFAMGYAPQRHTNVHLAVQPKAGSVASVGSVYGVTFTIYEAFAPRIDRLPAHWRGLGKGHATCRNFQFGVQMFGYHPTPQSHEPGDHSLLREEHKEPAQA